MSGIGFAHLEILVIIAVISFIFAVYLRLVLAALERITRSSAEDAFAHKRGGKHIVTIAEQGTAAMTSVHALRVLFAALYALSVAFIILGYTRNIWLAFAFSMLIIVISFGFMGVIVPSSLGSKHPFKIMGTVSTLLWLVSRVTALFFRSRELIEYDEQENEDQLAVLVERVTESDALEDGERFLLQSVFQLSRTLIREVMVPRTDMITIEANHSLEQALSLFSRSGFSRVPVVGDSIDELVGVLYLKDIIRRVHYRGNPQEVTVRDVMRKPTFVPETMVANDLLHNMQSSAVHIALVVDEYGGIAGLVTIEDLLEEIVGEMVDEHDQAHPEVIELAPNKYRVPARLALDDLGELFKMDIADDDVDTVGGLFAKTLGKVPISGSRTQAFGITLQADRFEGRRKRIATIIASKVDEDTADE